MWRFVEKFGFDVTLVVGYEKFCVKLIFRSSDELGISEAK